MPPDKPDDITGIIANSAKKALSELQQRCTEGLKALDQGDYLIALGSTVGLEGQIAAIHARLMVLREIQETTRTKTKTKKGNK